MDPIFHAIADAITQAMKSTDGGLALFVIALAIIWGIQEIITSIVSAIGGVTKAALKASKEPEKLSKEARGE